MLIQRILAVFGLIFALTGTANAEDDLMVPNQGFVPSGDWARIGPAKYCDRVLSVHAEVTINDAVMTAEAVVKAYDSFHEYADEDVSGSLRGHVSYYTGTKRNPFNGKSRKVLFMVTNYGVNPERQVRMSAEWPDDVEGVELADVMDLQEQVVSYVAKTSTYRVAVRKTDVPGSDFAVDHTQFNGTLSQYASLQNGKLCAAEGTTCTEVTMSPDGETASFIETTGERQTMRSFRTVTLTEKKVRSGIILLFTGSWQAKTDEKASFEKFVQSTSASFL